MKNELRTASLAALAALTLATPVEARQLEARVWLDRGHEPVLHHGDRVRLYYRTTRDAYVAIFRLDTNGTTRLVYPRSPHDTHFVRAGRDYRLVFPSGSSWFVEDDPGVGYYFAIASETPFQFGAFSYAANTGYGWDLGQVYRNVYHDPYVAMDDLVAALVPDWRYSPYALDYTTYHVGARYDYPRFLCYDCHGFRSFTSWNPYLISCTNFRVVIYNDPYYYPVYRYRGRRVVYVRPPVYRQPRFVFKERAYGEPNQPVRTARPVVPVPSTTVPPAPVGRGADDRVRRAVPVTEAPPRQGEPLRAPTSAPERRGDPTVLPPSRPSTGVGGWSGDTRPTTGTARPTVPRTTPTVGVAPGSTRPTRPTQVLPGRGSTDDIGLRRRGDEGSGGVRPPATVRPGQVTPPGSGTSRATPRAGTSRTTPSTAGPTRVTPPRTGPARATPPPTGTTRVTPPRTGTSRATPPRTVPSRAAPPRTGSSRVTPPRSGSRPPTGSSSGRPPVRPPRTGSGGGPF